MGTFNLEGWRTFIFLILFVCIGVLYNFHYIPEAMYSDVKEMIYIAIGAYGYDKIKRTASSQ